VGRNDYTCDDPDNEGNDDPIPDDVGENNPDEPDTDVDLPQPAAEGTPTDRPVFPGGTPTTGFPPSGSPTGNNANDPFDTDTPGGTGTISYPAGVPATRPLLPGDEVGYTPPCCPAEVKMYAINYNTGIRLQEEPVAVGTSIVGDCEVRFELFNEYLFDTATAFEFTHRCVDPGSPDGYGTELPGGTTPELAPSDKSSIYQTTTGAYRVLLPLTMNPIRDFYTNEPLNIYQKLTPSCSTGGGEMWVKYSNTDQSIYGFTICTGYAIGLVEVYELDPANPTVPGQQLSPIN